MSGVHAILASSKGSDADANLTHLIKKLVTEVNVSRRQVHELAKQYNAHKIYTKAKLLELTRDRDILKYEVMELRQKLDNFDQGKETALVAPQEYDTRLECADDVTGGHNSSKAEAPGPSTGKSHTAGESKVRFSSSISSNSNNSNSSSDSNTNSAISNTKSRARQASVSTKTRIRQQRLILLHHASTCTAMENCKVTRHCAQMKDVWNHIMETDCDDPNCSVKHCLSSRYVMNHYRRCQKPASLCMVCGPVRRKGV